MAAFFAWALLGLIIGAWFGESVFAAVVGATLGFLLARMSELEKSVDALRHQLTHPNLDVHNTSVPGSSAAVEQSESQWGPQAASVAQAARPSSTPAAVVAPTPTPTPLPAAPPPSPPPPSMPAEPAEPAKPAKPEKPTLIEVALEHIKRWFTEGNVPVKIGMLVLLAGVAALLKYATDAGWFHVSIPARLIMVAIAATVALAFGWRQRRQRRAFALAVQGGAIGILLLTVFAGFQLYHLLPATLAFALVIGLVLGAGLLAVAQDALALAILALLAGFAAPIAIRTGSDNHVALFSYYAVLNLAVFAIAWLRSWRWLNLLGFTFTFAIATAWGVFSYQPSLFSSTEPFLVLFFVLYLLIPLLQALRAPAQQRDLVQGTLLFGNPLAAFGLQTALLRDDSTALAWSALALAAVYAAMAWLWRRREPLHVLRDAWVILALGFATLAIPLAFSARVAGTLLALEGAGMVWLGLRQQRWLARFTGIGLQVLAALLAWQALDAVPLQGFVLNADFLGMFTLALAAAVTSVLYVHRAKVAETAIAAPLFFLWALFCWCWAWLADIVDYVPSGQIFPACFAFALLTIGLCADVFARPVAERMRGWLLRTAAVLFALCLLGVPMLLILQRQPFAGWMLGVMLLYALVGWRLLWVLRNRQVLSVLAHSVWLWQWALTLCVAALLWLDDIEALGGGVRLALVSAPLLLLWTLALWRPAFIAQPSVSAFPMVRRILLVCLLFVLGAGFLLALFHPGDSAPLPFIPVFNPLDLAMLVVVCCVARWLSDTGTDTTLQSARPALVGLLLFAWLTSVTLRGVHQLAGVAWNAALFESSLAQMSLTVVWSALGLLAWIYGSRRGKRAVWLVGAVLMAVVLLKLLLIDRAHLGNLFGIGSFLAFGLLCTVIGYFAPAPPKLTAKAQAESVDAI